MGDSHPVERYRPLPVQVATPANWKKGEDVIIVLAVSDHDARKKFPGSWRALKPYVRITSQPGKCGAAPGSGDLLDNQDARA